MNIKYIGPARDYSGYGEAVRHDIAALMAAGIEVTSIVPSYTLEIADFGELSEKVRYTENREIPYETIIIHTTPNIYGQYFEPGKYHIGRVFWETDKIPEEFAQGIEKYTDEVWTGSEYNKQAIQRAGVTKPIHIIPQAIDIGVNPELVKPYKTGKEGTYKFYSIFEWTNRKNPLALLEAYWTEFQNNESVSLTIKTYLDNFTPEKRAEIDSHINALKARLNFKAFAPVGLYRKLLDRSQMYRFHQSFDCFVSAHRGEGWGIPQMEALIMQKPVISTGAGGIHEYIKECAFMIPYTMQPLTGNNRNQQWYALDQNWAEIDQTALRQALRAAYADQIKAKELGRTGRDFVVSTFSPERVGEIMRDRLDQIWNLSRN